MLNQKSIQAVNNSSFSSSFRKPLYTSYSFANIPSTVESLLGKKNNGGDYNMFDPVYGPDKKFSEHYSKGQIFSAKIII